MWLWWEALDQWGDVARIEPFTGGVGVNEVWSVRVNGQLAVGRLGMRSDADLGWETELLRHLDREGMTVPVPVPIPTEDGRHFADSLVVTTYVEGGPPETEADWRRVADTLRQLADTPELLRPRRPPPGLRTLAQTTGPTRQHRLRAGGKRRWVPASLDSSQAG